MKDSYRDVIAIRLEPEERILLDDMMREEGWENISGFCKRKLFGKNPEIRFKNRQKRHAEKNEKEYLIEAVNASLAILGRQNDMIYKRLLNDMEDLKKSSNYSHEKFEDYVGKSLRAFRKRQDRIGNLVQKLMNIINTLGEDDNSKKVALGVLKPEGGCKGKDLYRISDDEEMNIDDFEDFE